MVHGAEPNPPMGETTEEIITEVATVAEPTTPCTTSQNCTLEMGHVDQCITKEQIQASTTEDITINKATAVEGELVTITANEKMAIHLQVGHHLMVGHWLTAKQKQQHLQWLITM